MVLLAGRAVPLLRRSLATQAPRLEKDCTSITPPYPALLKKLAHVRRVLNRPLTLSEKILYSHVIDPEASLGGGGRIRGEAYLQLNPERVAMQDASAQYAKVLLHVQGLLLTTVRQDGAVRLTLITIARHLVSEPPSSLQFMSAGLAECAVPTSIHCDHLIQAVEGAESDLKARSLLLALYSTSCFFNVAVHCHESGGL